MFFWRQNFKLCSNTVWAKQVAKDACNSLGSFAHKIEYHLLQQSHNKIRNLQLTDTSNKTWNLLKPVTAWCTQTVNQNINVATEVCNAVIKRTSSLTVHSICCQKLLTFCYFWNLQFFSWGWRKVDLFTSCFSWMKTNFKCSMVTSHVL